MVDQCYVTKIPIGWNVKREPRRPTELRRDYFGGMKFNDNYDWDNLWYDAIRLGNGNFILIGPPLNNLSDYLNKDPILAAGTPASIAAYDIDRAGIVVVRGPVNAATLQFTSGEPIHCSDISSVFDSKICMLTLQKDNPISWIRQWMLYHVSLGVDSFLIYDNGSTSYTVEQLETELQMLNATVKVVTWNVPYGPQGFDCNYHNTWDSDYAQSSMFEHAKRRYLANAKLVINADIDELLVIDKSFDDLIRDIVSANVAGYTYKGRWIEPYDKAAAQQAANIPFEQRRFEKYYCTDHTNPYGIGNKWMVIPMLSMSCQWSVHSTGATMIQNDNIYYGHYLAMNTNWSWGRDKYERNTANLAADLKLMHNLSKIRNKA